LPERDPHPEIHAALEHVLALLADARRAGPALVRFELMLLGELGFGLDLERCAATGATAELSYVSPRSGRAVSRAAGEPWQDKLLRLPAFLGDPTMMPDADALADGFAVTGFFLQRHVFEPRRLMLPDARESFVAAVLNVHRNVRAAS